MESYAYISQINSISTIILKMAVKVGKVMQDFDAESLPMGAGHSQMVKVASIGSYSASKDCVNSPALTAVFRMMSS